MKLPAAGPSQPLPVLRSPIWATTEGEEGRRSRPSCGVSCEILRAYSAEVASATEGSPRLAYSAEASASAAKAGHPRSKLRGIRRRRINQIDRIDQTDPTTFFLWEQFFSILLETLPLAPRPVNRFRREHVQHDVPREAYLVIRAGLRDMREKRNGSEVSSSYVAPIAQV